jgi:hypothetical protein
MTTTSNNRIDGDSADKLIRRRAKQATANFEEAKAKFAEDFATNPKYAIEWHAEKVARAQVHYEWWLKIAEVLDRRGVQEAVAYAAERIDIEVDSFFGSNSTCLWTNALRRAEAEVYHALSRREMRELRDAADAAPGCEFCREPANRPGDPNWNCPYCGTKNLRS